MLVGASNLSADVFDSVVTCGGPRAKGAKPCCSACAGHGPVLSAAALRDPHALAIEGMRNGQTMGDLLPTFVFPADVKAYKAKLDPHFKATNTDVSACAAKLPVNLVKGWTDFFSSWRAFVDGGVSLIASWEAQLDEAKRYEKELADWQAMLVDGGCKLSTPQIEPPGKPFPTGAALLIGGAVLVVAALGYSFYRTGQQAGARAQQGRRYLEGQIDRRLDAMGSSSSKSSGKALAKR
jgi:hypothetical protein